MKKIICIACFALLALAAKGQDLTGTWEQDSSSLQLISRARAAAGLAQVSESKLESELPAKMVFKDGAFRFFYADSSTLEGGYFVENGMLKVGTPNEAIEYKLIEQDGVISIELDGKQRLSFNKKTE